MEGDNIIGRRVRFLDRQGEGVIKNYNGNIYIVEDESGFEYPMLRNEFILSDISTEEEIIKIGKNINKQTSQKDCSKLKKQPKANTSRNERIVDLHQNALFPNLHGLTDVDIHIRQKQEVIKVLSEEMNHHGKRIVFIHGKGEGILRNEIIKELDRHKAHCSYSDASFRDYGYQGAILVIIK